MPSATDVQTCVRTVHSNPVSTDRAKNVIAIAGRSAIPTASPAKAGRTVSASFAHFRAWPVAAATTISNASAAPNPVFVSSDASAFASACAAAAAVMRTRQTCLGTTSMTLTRK